MELLVFVDMHVWDSSNTKELQIAFFPGKELQIKLLYSWNLFLVIYLALAADFASLGTHYFSTSPSVFACNWTAFSPLHANLLNLLIKFKLKGKVTASDWLQSSYFLHHYLILNNHVSENITEEFTWTIKYHRMNFCDTQIKSYCRHSSIKQLFAVSNIGNELLPSRISKGTTLWSTT